MSESEETPAQRQARIRRQKREAKINATAAERLDKITRLSGRAAESARNEVSSPGSGASTPPIVTPQDTSLQPQPTIPQMPSAANPDQARLQQEYLSALLKGPPQDGNEATSLPEQEEPMAKILSSLMSSMNGSADPNAAGDLPFNPEDLSKATGIPSFLTNMLMGNQKAPPTPAEIRNTRLWRLLHTLFAFLCGTYHLVAIGRAEDSFGAHPPAPPTFQNPFVIFLLGEVLLQSARIVTAGASGKRGPGLWMQMVKEFAGDGAIIVFLLGAASWCKGAT